MPIFFILKELNNGYCWKDFELYDFAYEYAMDVYSIPENSIDSVEVLLESKKVEITLFENKEILQEDWYHCLLKYAA